MKWQNGTWHENTLAALFSFFMVFGYSFEQTDSWSYVFGGVLSFCVSVLAGLLLFMLFRWGIHWLYGWLDREREQTRKVTFDNGLLSWGLDRHPIIGTCVFLLVAWMPYIVAQYPAAMGHDAYSQLNQALGYSKMTAHHPPFHSFWIGECVKLGEKWFNAEFGLFLHIFLQLVLIIGILGYFMSWLYKQKVGKYVRLGCLLFLGFFLLFPMYATAVLKDVPYSFIFMLYIILILELLEWYHTKQGNIWRILVLIAISSLMLMLLRKNGIYCALPTALLLVWLGWRVFRQNRKSFLLVMLLLLIPVGIYKGYEDWLLPRMGIVPGSIVEMFSIPFQQTARYARDCGTDVTQEEKAVINEVLDYDLLAVKYDPNISDPVKDLYQGPDREELIAYFKVWWGQFLKHPDVYFQATMNNIYGLFYPGVDNTYIFFDLLHEYGYNNFQHPEVTAEFRKDMAVITEGVLRFPGISLLNNMALWVWLFMLEFLYFWKKREWSKVLVGIPIGITVLVCIAGPVILGHPRYVFPIMLGAMVLMVPCIKRRGGNSNE